MTSDRIQASGLIHRNHLALIGIMDISSRPGVGGRIFSALGDQGINIELIVHLIDLEQEDHVVLCVDRDELEGALAVLEAIKEEVGAEAITNDPEVASISLFGLDFRAQHSVASRMCQALGSCNINIHAISTSLSTITCVIEAQRLDDAIQVLRKTFTLD